MTLSKLSVTELKAWLDSEEAKPLIIDVREPWEGEACRLQSSVQIPMRQVPKQMSELDSGCNIVVLCHHGFRSLQVCRFLAQHGFHKLFNVTGGIDAWAQQIDPSMARY
jgi:rhodanese-related sulfurtransferase